MELDHSLRPILSTYPSDHWPSAITSLGNAGGFSGAQFWRLSTPRGALCLRRWPREHPNRQRLEYIHAVLIHAAANGFDQLPTPIVSSQGRTFHSHEGYLWELSGWLPGKADFLQDPTTSRLSAAMEALARFHSAAATFAASSSGPDRAPGIKSRHQQLQRLISNEHTQIALNVREDHWPELFTRARRLLERFPQCSRAVGLMLRDALEIKTELQPCIRDIWHDHVLFQGDQVSGLIDFGAMQTETIAADIARLLGSLAGDNQPWWQIGLESYHTIRPLTADQRVLISAFDCSNVLLSGMNWLRWIYIDERRFEQRDKIIIRLDEIIARLERLWSGTGSA